VHIWRLSRCETGKVKMCLFIHAGQTNFLRVHCGWSVCITTVELLELRDMPLLCCWTYYTRIVQVWKHAWSVSISSMVVVGSKCADWRTNSRPLPSILTSSARALLCLCQLAPRQMW
jgi:hypothetical protein